MKKLLFLLLLLPLASIAQVYQVLPQFGYEMQRINAKLVLLAPSDTINNKTGIARIGDVLYAGNGTYWTAGGGGGGGSITLTKGSTPTSGFTSGRVMRDNAGTLDEYSVAGSSGVLVMTDALSDSIAAHTGGTVTSVGLTMPGTLFDASVPGSPVTSTGTLAPTIKNQIAYGIFGNNTGSSAAPAFFTNPYKDSIKITSNSYQDSIWARTNGTFVLQYVRSRLNTPGQLTDGATITWDCKITLNDSVTLAGNRTLAMSNAVAGMYGTLLVKQDATGSRTLTLPANSKVINGGAGAIVLTATAAAKDILSFYFDGTYYYWTYGKNYN